MRSLASRVVGAAAHGLFWAVVVAYAVSLVPPERVGHALSIVLTGPTLASLVALPLGSAVAHRIGWQVTFVGLAVACLLCAVLLSVAAPGGEADVSADGGGRWDGTAVPVLWVAVGGLFALVGFYALFTFVIPVSSAVAGIGAAAMPGVLLVTFLNLGVALGALLGSTISTRGTLSTLPFIAATTATLAVVPLLLSSRWSRRQQPEPRPTDEPGALKLAAPSPSGRRGSSRG